MARNLADAWRAVPHISLFDELDARPLLAAHAALRERDDGVTLTAWFVRAAVVALEAFPILNASLDVERDEIVFHGAVHMGVAVASDDGLVVPVVHDAHERDVVDLGARSCASPRPAAPVTSRPRCCAARRSPSPTSAPKAAASPPRSSARRRSRSSGSARCASRPVVDGDGSSPRPRCRSRCRPTTA